MSNLEQQLYWPFTDYMQSNRVQTDGWLWRRVCPPCICCQWWCCSLRGTASVGMHSLALKVWREQKPRNYSVLTYPHLRLSAPWPLLPAELNEPVQVSFSNCAESNGRRTKQSAVGGGAERQTVDSEKGHAFWHMTNNLLRGNAVKPPFTALADF